MDACKACARNFARSDRSVLCSGSCGRVFHPGCVGLNVTNFKSWAANVGLLWFCENCRVNFNPSIMDRESVILKTMRDLLLRVDSMDLRVGQFGENLKTLNSLLSISSSMRRDSNFSSRLQQFAMSGTTVYDPTDFHNSIDRLNLDLSLRSNPANNTILDVNDDLNDTLDNDDARNSRQVNVSQDLPNGTTAATDPKTATTFAISPATVTTAAASQVTPAPPATMIAPTAATITTFANVVSRSASAAAAAAVGATTTGPLNTS